MSKSSAIEEAARAGIDLAAIEENLRLTPEQRAMKHQVALDLLLESERLALESGGLKSTP